ncbi:Biopolymer transport protein ExbD/TolR [gut metagenome]|uniref:Biopolymer transport protein ExbD/TolR n=1 Tax=gut metagenome TaxID=749906 RepID=J9GPY0_9ZZZZ
MAKSGNSKQKKMDARVDMTPMVDMIMLLVTFFMLCTTLLKPQTMEIAMPSDKDDLKDEQKNQAKASEAITILIDKENTIYYFEGKPEEATLNKTSYGKDGIRAVLLHKNQNAKKQVDALKQEFALKEKNDDTQAEFKKRLSEIKNAKGTPTVVIKASDEATYLNLIDVLDEMQICNIGKYVIDKFADYDRAMIDGTANAGGAQN